MKKVIIFCCLLWPFLGAHAATVLEGVFYKSDNAATTILLRKIIPVGSTGEPLDYKADITGQPYFTVSLDIKQAGFYQLYIIKGDGNTKYSYDIPVYLYPDKTVRLKFYSPGPRQLRCDTDRRLDAINQALIAQHDLYLQLLTDQWKHPVANEAAALSYLRLFDLIADSILLNPSLTTDARRFIRFKAVDNYTTALFQFSFDTSPFSDNFNVLKQDKVRYYSDPFMGMFPGYVLNQINQLNIATGLRPFTGRKTAAQINTQIQVLKRRVKDSRLTDPVIESMLTAYITRYKAGDNFKADVVQFTLLTAGITNEGKRTSLIRQFKNLEYTLKGAALPPVPMTDLKGRTVSLDQFKGKYLLIDMWASWCVPCCKMVPVFQQLERQYEGKPINFVSLSVDADTTKWKAKMQELNMHGHQLLDGSGTFMKYLNISAIPHYLLYGPDGKLLDYHMGMPDTPAFKAKIDRAIGQ